MHHPSKHANVLFDERSPANTRANKGKKNANLDGGDFGLSGKFGSVDLGLGQGFPVGFGLGLCSVLVVVSHLQLRVFTMTLP